MVLIRGLYPSDAPIELPRIPGSECGDWMDRKVESFANSRVGRAIDHYARHPKQLFESIRQHGDIISNVGYLIFTAGMLIPWVPEKITQIAFVAVNAMGILYLDFMVSFTVKTGGDCYFSCFARSWSTAALTAFRTINAVSDTALMALGLIASCALLLSKPKVATTIYAVTRPWGLTFLVVAIALDICNYVAYKTLSDRVKTLSKDDNASDRMRNILRDWKNFGWRGGLEGDKEERDLAARIRATMDKYTWKTLKGILDVIDVDNADSARITRGFNAVMQNIETQRVTERNTIGLTVINYVALGVGKALPNTIWQGLSYLSASILNTLNQCYKKGRQHGQREDLKEAFGVSDDDLEAANEIEVVVEND